jgi:anti-sigma regulatory factor (Ser/Thr protein kinase)
MLSREVPATAEAIGPLRRWVEGICADAGGSCRQRADVALAVSEALSNVVMHAYVGRTPHGTMRIRTDTVEHRLLVEVEDDGIGIRPRLDSPGGGMGLALMAMLAADLELGAGPAGNGALVKMAFALA